MTKQALENLLKELRQLPAETEWLEFKAAKTSFHFDNLGKYFSALSNEANLKNKEYAWLIFGIHDKTKALTNTQYRPDRAKLDSLKVEIANHTNGRITFEEIHELQFPEGRVILFQIPPAPQGIPITWKGHYYGRDGESLQALNIQEIETIRNQVNNYDWSAQIVEGATIDDLDTEAIFFAREKYIEKIGDAVEVNTWDNITFLNKAYVTKQGKITNTAILLLGKPESKHFIEPAQPLITWVLRDKSKDDLAYEHFHLPFIFASNKLYAKIRNIKYVYMKDDTLFPTEIDMYDPFLIREALHNCIAHQDYQQGRRINVVEYPSELLLTNAGSFIPESIEKVIDSDSPPDYYRNAFLATAMTNLRMIEIRGGGIKKMYNIQRKRFFPMPDYDLSANTVKVRIFGKILDENYTKLLIRLTDLELRNVILLDFIQKGKGALVSIKQANYLKNENLIEGRRPNYYVSAEIAQLTDKTVQYTKNKAFEKQKYKDYIVEHIKNHGSSTRKEIDDLLFNVMPTFMTQEQKKTSIHNLISKMSGEKIKNIGSRKYPKWVLIGN